ncbi:MAG: V-type ATPase subunit [Acidaminococcales bacterium]|jgi:V/A-type H+-transporting ATPase subunit C|nr:V-type ATPase subunit [Acidaminococcales bacterium]
MPQTSYQYAIGRIKVLETHMLDAAKFKKLIPLEKDEFFRALQESGYGEGILADGDLDELIRSELKVARQLIWSVTPDPKVTGLFLLPIDAHNLKVFLKARVFAVPSDGLSEEGGLFPPDVLQKAVVEKRYAFFPPTLKDELDELEKALARGDAAPRLISARVDGAIFKYIKSVLAQTRNEYATGYFSLLADLTNAKSFIRARELGWKAEDFSSVFVVCGGIAREIFLQAFALPDEHITPALGRGANSAAVAQALDGYFAQNSMAAFEKRIDSLRMRFVRARRNDPEGIGAIVGYLIGKETEARALGMILSARGGGEELDLPGLYM